MSRSGSSGLLWALIGAAPLTAIAQNGYTIERTPGWVRHDVPVVADAPAREAPDGVEYLTVDRQIRLTTGKNEPAFRDAVRKAGPAIMGRGVVQISGYLDLVLASLLAVGAVARLRYAQTLYLLPISLFAMSVAAAALPELARDLNLRDTKGALVWEMSRSSNAYRAGIRPGDVVVALNGKRVDDPSQLQRPILEAPIGSIVTLSIIRDGETREVKTQVESQSAPRRVPE